MSFPNSIYHDDIKKSLQTALDNNYNNKTIKVKVDGQDVLIETPFPSPADWRDHWIYFVMVDRFNNPNNPPINQPWDDLYGGFQGGTINGIHEKLDYLEELGVGAIWLTPVFKNSINQDGSYHGYAIQDFLSIDPRFGTSKELKEMINEAHARGMYIIFDIVLNHSGDVFAYDHNGEINSQLGYRNDEYNIKWRDEKNIPKWSDIKNSTNHRDAVVWPKELHDNEYFRRKGMGGELGGDFCSLKEFVTEKEKIENNHKLYPVRNILIDCYKYIIAEYDIDGFRIDTLKYISRDFSRIFGNAVREFALSIGKKNFITFGEVWDSEEKIAHYIGRYASDEDDLIGVDSALDFPLYYKLPGVVKGFSSPLEIYNLYNHRKNIHRKEGKILISSHGEASRFYVTFLDNHDQHNRFHPGGNQYDYQVTMGIGCLFTLFGVPCLYYGTEQGLSGAYNYERDNNKGKDWAVREALWGKPGNPFDKNNIIYKTITNITKIRNENSALKYGRLYFRENSGNGTEFGICPFNGGLIAFSRILSTDEILVLANTGFNSSWYGEVLIDYFLNKEMPDWEIIYSNRGSSKSMKVKFKFNIKINGGNYSGPIAVLPVELKQNEFMILKKKIL